MSPIRPEKSHPQTVVPTQPGTLYSPFLVRSQAVSLAKFILAHVLPRSLSGFTLEPITRKVLDPCHFDDLVFLVSLPNFEFIPDRDDIESLSRWIWQARAQLGSALIGGWQASDRYCLDVTVRVLGKNEAVDLGCAWRQEAIYHPRSNTTIGLDLRSAIAA